MLYDTEIELRSLRKSLPKLNAINSRFKAERGSFRPDTYGLKREIDRVIRLGTKASYEAHNAYNYADGLDIRTNHYFHFCCSQVARLNSKPHTALEIGYLLGISPFIVACFISVYGLDYAYNLMDSNFLLHPERGLKGCVYSRLGELYTLENRISILHKQKRLCDRDLDRALIIGRSPLRSRSQELQDYLISLNISGPVLGNINSVIFEECPMSRASVHGHQPHIDRFPFSE